MGFLDFLKPRPRGFRAAAKPEGLATYPLWVHPEETGSRLTREIVHTGSFEPFETMLVQRLLPHFELFIEAAAGVGWYTALAQRVMKEEATPAKRLARAFKHLTGRAPTEAEAKVLLGAYERQLATYRKNPEAAAKLLKVGEPRPSPKLDAAELAAYANVCILILNLDETVTKE